MVVSDNDLHFDQFDDVYRKVVQELSTSACPRGALGDILDRWIARVEDALIAGGADEHAPPFDALVQQRMNAELASLTSGTAPEDMSRVLRALFLCKQAGKLVEAGALLSWLSASEHVAVSAKRAAGVKGDIGSREAMDYLHGLLEIIKASGYKGLVIVIDEAETILRMRRDVRGKSLNGIYIVVEVGRQSGVSVQLWHVKAAGGQHPSVRVTDLEEAIAQAMKSRRWITDPEFWHELGKRLVGKSHPLGRIVEGSRRVLLVLCGESERWNSLAFTHRRPIVRGEIWVAQPGLSRRQFIKEFSSAPQTLGANQVRES